MEIIYLMNYFLTQRQITKFRNNIENNISTDIKLSKAQLSKIIQSGGLLGKILGPLLKTGLPLLKSVIKPLDLLDLTAASSAIDAGVQKKRYMVLDQLCITSARLCIATHSSLVRL